jgi:hypothetical protein
MLEQVFSNLVVKSQSSLAAAFSDHMAILVDFEFKFEKGDLTSKELQGRANNVHFKQKLREFMQTLLSPVSELLELIAEKTKR